MGEYVYEEKESFDGKKVKVLGPTYEAVSQTQRMTGRLSWVAGGPAQLSEDGAPLLVQQGLVR